MTSLLFNLKFSISDYESLLTSIQQQMFSFICGVCNLANYWGEFEADEGQDVVYFKTKNQMMVLVLSKQCYWWRGIEKALKCVITVYFVSIENFQNIIFDSLEN